MATELKLYFYWIQNFELSISDKTIIQYLDYYISYLANLKSTLKQVFSSITVLLLI